MRLITRKERPHPGAQLRITDADGMRITCLATNTPDRPIAELELRHRQRARAGDRIRAARATGRRGAGARAEALLGRQSQPLADLAERDAQVEASLMRIKSEPDLVAPGWTLYSVRPESVEFWQGDKQRRHTRLVYLSSPDGWTKQMLWP